MADLLFSRFKQQAVDASHAFDQADLEIDMIGVFSHCARSPCLTQVICSPYVHVQLASGATGICFAYEEVDTTAALQLVRTNARSAIDRAGWEVQIALVDALFAHINKERNLQPYEVVEFQGRPSEKALDRARYIASLVQATRADRVGVIGCVEPMIKCLLRTGCEIRIADIHSPYRAILGIRIERDAMPIVDWATRLIVSGSALWTQTITQILNRASDKSIFTVIFSMTGHNIAPHYLDHGAAVIVSEHFPYYWFAGTTSKLELYVKRHDDILSAWESSAQDTAARLTVQQNSLADRRRPCPVALIELGGLTGLNIPRLVRKLNSLQKLFRYAAVTPVTNLSDYDELHCYSYDRLFSLAQSHITGTEFQIGIGLIHENLQRDSFNYHDVERGTGVVTVADADQYCPTGKTLEQYVAYLILCESFCLAGGRDFEHEEVRYCLFDLCRIKSSWTRCIESPYICSVCLERLKEAGFSDQDIGEAQGILDFVAKTHVLDMLTDALNNPIVGVFLGGLLVQTFGGFLYALPRPWPLVAGLATAAGLCISLLVVIRRNRRKRDRFKRVA